MGVSEKLLFAFWGMTENKDNKRIQSQTPPDGISVISDLSYINDGKREHLLDVYYPQNTLEKLPVIIDIHGGGWMYGYKEINKYYCMHLAALGFTVFSINYTLAPKANYKQQVRECFDAFRWIAENGEKYPCDMNNVFLTGDSAGGHLAALCCEIFGRSDLPTVFNVQLPSFNIRAVGFTCGAFSMPVLLSKINVPLARTYARFILGPDMRDPQRKYHADAVHLLEGAKMPPVYLSSSKQDFIGFETKKFCKRMDELQIPYKLRFWDKGKDHVLEHVFNILQPSYSDSIITNTEMTDFFKSNII